MSGQNGVLTSQQLCLPVMLAIHTDSYVMDKQPNPHLQILRFCLFVKIDSCSVIENNRRISSLFSQVFDYSENEIWPSKIYLAGYHVGPSSKIILSPDLGNLSSCVS